MCIVTNGIEGPLGRLPKFGAAQHVAGSPPVAIWRYRPGLSRCRCFNAFFGCRRVFKVDIDICDWCGGP